MFLNHRDGLFCHVHGVEVLCIQTETSVRAGLFFQEAGRRTVSTHHDLAATDILVLLEHRTVGLHDACIDQTKGVRHALVPLIIGKVNRNIAADGIQLLAGRNPVHESEVIPTEAEDGRRL